MKQTSLKLNLNVKKTRKQVFLEQMEQVVPWAALVELIAPYYPEIKTGRPPFSLQTMLRVHFMQQWFTLSDPAMEEAFFDTPLYREFAQLEEFGRLPDESTILRFRHRLEKHKRSDAKAGVTSHVAMKPGKHRALDKEKAIDAMLNQVEKIKAGIRSKVEHPFRLIKRQFGHGEVRYHGLKRNTAQRTTLFAVSNLWMVRRKLMGAQGCPARQRYANKLLRRPGRSTRWQCLPSARKIWP